MNNLQDIPGPKKGNLIFGSALEFGKNPIKFLEDMVRTYGDFVRFYLMTEPIYLVNNPDTVHQILFTHADKFQKQALAKFILKRFLGNGLVMNDGESWRRQRRLAQPSFHMKRIETYAQMIVGAATHMLSRWHDGQTLDVQDEMMAVTLRIISQMLFQTEVEDKARQLGQAFNTLNELVIQRSRLPLPVPDWLPTPQNVRERQAIAVVDGLVLGQINEHRAAGEDRGDLLSTLMLARDEDGSSMSDHQLRDELMTMVFAGHETTALALSWAFYDLSQNPAVEERLLQELTSVLGARLPAMADLPNLPYTEMFLKEVLRLHSPVWMFSREPTEEIELEGYVLPKGSGIFISPDVMHRNPKYYPQPERFDPERFNQEREQHIPKAAFIPFSAGPRVCIGNIFAMTEARLLLATVLPRYHLNLVPGEKIEAEALMTRHFKSGLKMELVAR